MTVREATKIVKDLAEVYRMTENRRRVTKKSRHTTQSVPWNKREKVLAKWIEKIK